MILWYPRTTDTPGQPVLEEAEYIVLSGGPQRLGVLQKTIKGRLRGARGMPPRLAQLPSSFAPDRVLESVNNTDTNRPSTDTCHPRPRRRRVADGMPVDEERWSRSVGARAAFIAALCLDRMD